MKRHYLTTLLCSCGLFVVSAAVVNWVVDPFRFLS